MNQRLKKEKQEVFVLNNDSAKEKKTSSVFQDYRFSYTSDSVMNVMASALPDVVVFCGALDTIYDWKKKDNQIVEYVGGLTNVLTCAAAAKVKRFVYLSSADVFSKSEADVFKETERVCPASQREKAIVQGENICATTAASESDMQVSVVRLAEVYGACAETEVSGVCADFTRAFHNNEEVSPNPEIYHELLYIDDAVDAVYKVITEDSQKLKTVYHIAADSSVSEETIYNELLTISGQNSKASIHADADGKKEDHSQKGKTNAQKKPLFVSTTQSDLGFAPKYTLTEGLTNLYKQNIETKKEENTSESKKEKKKVFVPIIETIVAFFVVQLFVWFTKDAAFHSVIDVYLIYTLVIAVVLGALPSSIAVILSIIGKYMVLLVDNASIEIFRQYENYLWILQIFALSVLTGYIRDQYTRVTAEMERDKKDLSDELESIKAINDSNVEVKEIFENRLENYKDSYAKVYDIISQLDDLESKAIIFKAASVVADIMKSDDVAIYVYEEKSDFCRLMASTSELAKGKGKSFHLSDYAKVKECLMNNKIYMNREFDERMPMFATGTYTDGRLEVVAMIWTMDLLDVNLHQSNLLSMLSKLMERSMSRAMRYMDSIKNSTYVENTNVMEKEAFGNMLDIYCAGESQGLLEYSLLKVLTTESENKELYSVLGSITRETDYVGLAKDNALYVLLTNSNEKDLVSVVQRFKERSVKVQAVEKKAGKTANEVFAGVVF